ncbi:hypothetical protein [Sulfurisphaera tokodaii]|nr:hypothetical protein [Sulfurisphaera tokodaii]
MHWTLSDMFTEAGVYVKKNGKWRMFALAHYKYDNPCKWFSNLCWFHTPINCILYYSPILFLMKY